ncbi:hypothetical protein ACHAPJ_006586 [Fusarium lateritium]
MDYSKSQEAAKEIRTEGTGLGLLSDKKFQKWFTSDRGLNVLVGTGRPGTGKTILASLVVDEIKRVQQDLPSSNVGLAYFYFSYKVSSQMRKVALALLEQLYLQSPTPADEVKDLENRSSQGKQISFREIVVTITTLSNRFQKCYIVIDALDECASDYQQDLLHLLGSIRDTRCRLFVTSRPFQNRDLFESYPLIRITTSKRDVELFVTSHLEKSAARNDVDILRKVTDAITESSKNHGMFLLVTLQVREVLSKNTTQEITKWLSSFRDHAASEANLEFAYQKELDQISKLTPPQTKLAQWTLTWLYFARRPLEAQELLGILTTTDELVPLLSDESGTEAIVRACMGLVRLVQVRDSTTVTFWHFSVKELFDLGIGKGGTHLLPESSVAMNCLSYLSHIEEHRIYDGLTFEAVSETLSNHPFLLYAASHWGRHVTNLGMDEKELNVHVVEHCLAILTDRWMIAFLSQILLRDKDLTNLGGRLVKFSALHTVAYFGLPWAVDRVWAAEASSIIGWEDSWGRTAIHIAAEEGHPVCLEKLLTKTPLTFGGQRTDAGGKTPWHYAAMSGNVQSLKVLASKYALDIERDAYDKRGLSPLQYAAEQQNGEAFQCLVDMYPPGEESNVYKEEALKVALINGKTNIVQIILDHITPRYDHLLIAINSGFAPAVKLLLDYIDDLDQRAAGQRTALLEAALTGNNTILSFLIRSGASLERVDREGRTALVHAVDMKNVDGVKLLLGAGANPATPYSKDMGLIAHAASQNMTEIIPLLLNAGPSSKDLKQAIFCAAKRGHSESVQLLLRSGSVTANERSVDGQTLSEVAREAGYEEIVALLQESDPHDQHSAFQTINSESSSSLELSKDAEEEQLSRLEDKQILGMKKETHEAATHVRKDSPSSFAVTHENQDLIPRLNSRDTRVNVNNEVPLSLTTTADQELRGKAYDTTKTGRGYNITWSRPQTQSANVVQRDNQPQSPQRSESDQISQTRVDASQPAWYRPPEPQPSTAHWDARPAKTGATFLTLNVPLPVDDLILGMIVADPRDPLRSYLPKDKDRLRNLTKEWEFETVTYDWSMSQAASKTSNASVASMLSSLVDLQRTSHGSQVDIQSPRMHRRQMKNHDNITKQIYSAYAGELMGMLENRKEVFVVVGLLIATDLEVQKRLVVSPEVDVLGLSVGGLGVETSQVSSFSGDRVLAVQYRVVKHLSRSSFKNLWTKPKETVLDLGTYFKGRANENLF